MFGRCLETANKKTCNVLIYNTITGFQSTRGGNRTRTSEETGF